MAPSMAGTSPCIRFGRVSCGANRAIGWVARGNCPGWMGCHRPGHSRQWLAERPARVRALRQSPKPRARSAPICDCLRTVHINCGPWLKSESTTCCRRPDMSTPRGLPSCAKLRKIQPLQPGCKPRGHGQTAPLKLWLQRGRTPESARRCPSSSARRFRWCRTWRC